MKSYKVIALSVGAKGNRIFHSGDTVSEANFIEGRAEELVKLGFLKPLGLELVEESEDVDSDLEESEEKEETEASSDDVPAFEDISKKQIIARLFKAGAQFNPSNSKQDLYDILIAI